MAQQATGDSSPTTKVEAVGDRGPSDSTVEHPEPVTQEPLSPEASPRESATVPRRLRRRVILAVVALVSVVVLLAGGTAVVLTVNYAGTPSAAAGGTGHDSEWLGHAWVDGRKTQSDVDKLASQLRETGIRDLFVHSGPLRDDGSLDETLIPQAAWFVRAMHTALPGARVQAWLGATSRPDKLRLDSVATQAAIVGSVGQVLDRGFDGVHFDFEPVSDGDPALLEVLRQTREVTRARDAVLSISAIHVEPVGGAAAVVDLVPGRLAMWSGGYLRQVALEVDQVAVMAYDTALPTEAMFGGYVRMSTRIALDVVPPEVTLFIGVPAYHDNHLGHHESAETVTAAVRGIRLAMGERPADRAFGVAMYVDFAATDSDWAAYHDGWLSPRPDR